MNDSLQDLPVLQIIGVTPNDAGAIIRGKLEGWSHSSDGSTWFWLWVSDTEAIIPVIQALDFPSGMATVLVSKSEMRETIRPGATLHWMSSYWRHCHVTMIRDGNWNKREFKPDDAIHFELDGKKGSISIRSTIPEGARQTHIESRGWDHEHCEICSGTIGGRGSSFGYINEKQMW